MVTTAPHYLLFSEAAQKRASETGSGTGRWRFVLESLDGDAYLEAEDEEVEDRDRLELLAVVRGLEALDHPSRVTLISAGQYINHGFRRGLPEWRESGWMWERFGEWVPVKNRDLWQRVDRALQFHSVHCRSWRFDEPHVQWSRSTSPHRKGLDRVSLVSRFQSWLEQLFRRYKPMWSAALAWPSSA